jgi:LCP family protein required for cell wall assembly
VRTTLKRGIGRGASVNGDGRAILPPGALTPITRYQQPPRRHGGLELAGKIALWLLGTIVMLAGAIGGGTYLFFHHSVAAVEPHSRDVKLAAQQLHTVPPNRPAIALVIGYDKRFGIAGSRSDTIMLIRAQPNPKAISLLSFPRDLTVDVKCPGQDYGPGKINSAYAYCGAPGTVATVRALTGLPINYLITVRFRGFTQVVDKLGGVWIDVDRRYFHSNAGTALGSEDRYAEINLQPGYQKLNGAQALAFVRFRHADDDIHRNARQQLFVKAIRQQISASISLSNLIKLAQVVSAITHNTEIATAGGHAPSEDTILSYAAFAYGLPSGHVFQTKFDASVGVTDVTASTEVIQGAVRDFENPDVEAPEKAASVVLHRRIGKRARAPRPSQTTVTVLNGNGIAGSATLAANGLDSRGYRILYPPNQIPANAPAHTCVRPQCFTTQVFFNPSKRRSKAAARRVANLFGSANVAKMPAVVKPYTYGSMVIVVVGQTFHGTLAPGPVDHTPPKQPPSVRRDFSTVSYLRKRQHKVPFKLEIPTLIEKSSSLSTVGQRPIRTYRINGDKKAVRLTFTMGNGFEYWGIEQTDWEDAPVLKDANFVQKIKGREFDFYWNGPHLHMVVLHENGATYWVVNTLLDSLSPQTMTAIAKGLHPMGAPHHKKPKRKKKR